MTESLTSELHDRLDSISPEDWERLFPGHIDSRELLWLTAAIGMDAFEFGSIVVRHGGVPIMLLPLFHTRFFLPDLTSPRIARLLKPLARLAPGILSPRLLGVGFVEGEWTSIGIRPGLDPAILQQAWQLADQTLTDAARRFQADMTVLLNLRAADIASLPTAWSRSFTAMDSYPYGILPIHFDSADTYLAGLSKATRKDLRAKQRAAVDIEIVRSNDPRPWLDAIWDLYSSTVRDADIAFGIQRRSTLEEIRRHVPGAHYVLYLLDGRPIAFNLLIDRGDALIDKYFAADPAAGKDRGLYFVSWLENLQYAIDRGIPLYYAGPAAERTKARLGCSFVPCVTLFRHRSPVASHALSTLRPLIAYHPQGSAPCRLYAPDPPPAAAPLTTVGLDLDGSFAQQQEITQRFQHRIDLSDLADRLRLSAEPKAIEELLARLRQARRQIPGPWLTFVGSGDFHHVALALLQTLQPSRPFTLVTIDNHPDWFFELPQFHCGNWVSGVWKQLWLEQVIMIGQDSDDFRPYRFLTAPFHQLCEGRLTLHPLRRNTMHAPLRWPRRHAEPKRAQRHWWGTTLGFRTIREAGAPRLFHDIAQSLSGRDVYLSIDKDCLAPPFAATDWGHGGLTRDELVTAVRELASASRLIGIDICGDTASSPLKGLWKRLDAWRWGADHTNHSAAARLNQQTNLAIVDALAKSEVLAS